MESNDKQANEIISKLKGSLNNSVLFETMRDEFVKKNILKKGGLFSRDNIDIYSATKFCGDLIKQVLSGDDEQAKQHVYDIFNNCIKIICLVKTGSKSYSIGDDAIRNVDSQNANSSEALLNYVLSFYNWFSEHFTYNKDMNAAAGLQSMYKKIGLKYDDFVDLVQCVFRNLLVSVVDDINQCPVDDKNKDKGLRGILESIVRLFCNVIVDIRLKDLTAKPNYKQGLQYKDICIVLDTINKCFPEEAKQNNGEKFAQQQNSREKLMRYFFGLFDLVTEFVIYRKDGFGSFLDIVETLAELTPSNNVVDGVFRKTFAVLKAGYNFLSGNLKLTKEDILPDEIINKMKAEQTKNENKSNADNVLFDINNDGDEPEFEWEDFINDIFLAVFDHKLNNSQPEENLNNCLEVLYSNENEFLFDLNSWLKKLDGRLFWLIEYFLKLAINAMAAKFPGDFSLKKVGKSNPADELFSPDEHLVNDPKKKDDIVTQNLCMNENLRKIYFMFETHMLGKRFYKDSLEMSMIRTLSEKFGSIFNVLTALQKSIQDTEKYPNKLSAVVSFVLENLPPKKILEYIMQNDALEPNIYDVKMYIVCGFIIMKLFAPGESEQKLGLIQRFKKFVLEFVGDDDFAKILRNQKVSSEKNIKAEFRNLINNIYELPLKDCCSVFLLDCLDKNEDADGTYITKMVNRLKQLNEKSTTPKEKLEALRKVEAENQNNNNNECSEKVKDEGGIQDTGENENVNEGNSNNRNKLEKAENSTINKEKAVSKFEVKNEENKVQEKSGTLNQIGNKSPIEQKLSSTSNDEEKLNAALLDMIPESENNSNNNDNINLKTDNIDNKENVEVKEKLDQVNVNLNLFVNKDRKVESFNSTQKNKDISNMDGVDRNENPEHENNKVKEGEKNSNPNPNVNVNEIENKLKKYSPSEEGNTGIIEEKIADAETENAIENTSSAEESKKEELSRKERTKCRIRIVLLGILTLAGVVILAGIGLTILWMALITAITSVSITLTQLLIVVGEVFLGGGLLGLAAYIEYKLVKYIIDIWSSLANTKTCPKKNMFTNMNGRSELSMSDKIDRVQENNSRQYNNPDNIDKIEMEKKIKI